MQEMLLALLGRGSDDNFDRLADVLSPRELGVLLAAVLQAVITASLGNAASLERISREARRIRASQQRSRLPLMFYEAALRIGVGDPDAARHLDPDTLVEAAGAVINSEVDSLTARSSDPSAVRDSLAAAARSILATDLTTSYSGSDADD